MFKKRTSFALYVNGIECRGTRAGVLLYGYRGCAPILAINVGATAPLILASIALNAPNLSPPSN